MKKQYDDDDGRTIANMNVEGMPWYRQRRSESKNKMSMDELSKDERKGLYFGIIKAVALVAIVFAAAFFLLILFLTQIWS